MSCNHRWLLPVALAACPTLAEAQCIAQDLVPAPPLPEFSQLGQSVAFDGQTIAVGHTFVPAPSGEIGLVNLFGPGSGGLWIPTATVPGPATDPQSWFGRAVAVDGRWLAVGAPMESGTLPNSGAVYVYQLIGGQPVFFEKLRSTGRQLGRSLALEGGRLLAGGDDAAHVFELGPNGWIATQDLFAPPSPGAAEFGASVTLDGDTLAVGSPWFDAGPSLGQGNVGSVRLYDRVAGQWQFTQQFEGELAQGNFGQSVSLSGERLAVGAYRGGAGAIGASHTGAAFVFDRSGGAWVQQQKLLPSDSAPGDDFGWSVDLEGDRLLVGGIKSSGPGRAFVFDLVGSTWSEQQVVEPLALDGNGFGVAVAQSSGRCVVGSFSKSTRTQLLQQGEPLFACPDSISVASGGRQDLFVDGGAASAGLIYLVLGSASGTSPGIPLGGFLLPLVADGYFQLTLSEPSSGPLAGTLGVLDGSGFATAGVQVPAGLSPALVGVQLSHAACVLDPAGPPVVTLVSDAASLQLLP
ncbi:hypothetical protein [Engelhardtia mirabilis]|uniref:Cortical protein marker for cell polarity n=1 Tax=Engelhardtia mirabilis TaxID=2528011 RepID=A0A518BFX4_9BACT|nr:hypothetical protein Pla133_09440 [Planctomycetes bacterium Pla133]QDV00204.1 hypothetical protein Pla86_09430 [Planctomycetes bacterium Pla86]